MRIMTILGSPRPHGNTAKVLAWIEQRWLAAGHDLDSVNMINHHVPGCSECMACKRNGNADKLCAIQDDANVLFHRMISADILLVAAPVFCWGFPAQIKGLIDRLFCMMDYEGRHANVPRLYDKRIALLLTGGGEEADNADLVIRGFQYVVEFLQARMAGHLYVPNCTTPDKIGDDIKAHAIEFADTLAQPGMAES